jgi:GTPase
MKWRLREGQGEAIYEIGVEDSGMLAGLTDLELDASLATLQRMAERLALSNKFM